MQTRLGLFSRLPSDGCNFPEGLEVINDVPREFKMRAVGCNKRDSVVLVTDLLLQQVGVGVNC